eukprot:GHVN01086281.1.p1 GENE.GHVN01086281.1~~GHVN01086281.1.p1  ORF type:complete len:148 (+),score=32.32 GHVN01086281.1:221-664(+)
MFITKDESSDHYIEATTFITSLTELERQRLLSDPTLKFLLHRCPPGMRLQLRRCPQPQMDDPAPYEVNYAGDVEGLSNVSTTSPIPPLEIHHSNQIEQGGSIATCRTAGCAPPSRIKSSNDGSTSATRLLSVSLFSTVERITSLTFR